jgi:transposase-like protein
MERIGEIMPRTRKNHPPALKAKVAIEAIRGQRTISEIAQQFSVHPNLVSVWKRQALDLMVELFTPHSTTPADNNDVEKEELYRQIGQMKVEMDFLKKTLGRVD